MVVRDPSRSNQHTTNCECDRPMNECSLAAVLPFALLSMLSAWPLHHARSVLVEDRTGLRQVTDRGQMLQNSALQRCRRTCKMRSKRF